LIEDMTSYPVHENIASSNVTFLSITITHSSFLFSILFGNSTNNQPLLLLKRTHSRPKAQARPHTVMILLAFFF